MAKILLIEDEENIGTGLVFNLKLENYKVEWAKTGERALSLWKEWCPDLIILDLMLPDIDGIDILKEIRSSDPKTSVLILSAKDQAKDKIIGLKEGSDDYLPKPFNLEELLLRIESILRRSLPSNEETFKFGEFLIDKGQLLASSTDRSINLTEQEVKILQTFVENKGQVVSRELILTNALGYKESIESRTVDNFIVRIRKYFEKDPKSPILIKSIRGKGYIYE